MKKILNLIFAIMLIGCNKNDDIISSIISKDSGESTLVQSIGSNSGATSFDSRSSLTSKSLTSNDSFLSQLPLVEYRHIIAVDYEYENIYEINPVTNDTISIQINSVEVARDTLGFETGPLWLPFQERLFHSLYIGLPGVQIDSSYTFQMKLEVKNLNIEDDELFLSSIYNKDNNGGRSENGITSIILYKSGYVEVNSNYFVINDNVPIYDEFGNISDYSTGIEVPQLFFRGFTDGLNPEYTISIKLNDGTEIIQDFSAIFVSQEVYLNRQCWLEGNIECQEYF